MVMKRFLLSLLVAFLATLSPAVAQMQLSTANNKKFNRIIDDYVLGLVRNISCRPELPTIRIEPLANIHYLLMVQNPVLREPSTFELSFNTAEKTWNMTTDSKLTYDANSMFKFVLGKTVIVQPEIDNKNILTLKGSNNTLMSFAVISSSHIQIDPCVFVSISPNPVYDDTNVVIESEGSRNAKMIIYDNFGNPKQVITNIRLVAGKNNQTISLRNEKPGLYRVVVEAEGKRQVVPIQKW